MYNIPIKVFENEFYNTIKTNKQNCIVKTIDFIITGSNNNTNTNTYNGQPLSSFTSNNFSTISPTIIQKNIILKPLTIKLSSFNYQNTIQELIKIIDNKLKTEFFNKVSNIITTSKEVNFNFSITQLEKKYSKKDIMPHRQIGEIILSKIFNGANYITKESRMGPANWVVLNKKTYDKLYKHMTELILTYDKNGNIVLNNIPILVNDLILDNEILLGRKNRIEETGINAFLLTDENDNLLIYKTSNISTINSDFTIYYAVEELGTAEVNYLKINTTNLAEIRYKKLQKINSKNV
jgi:hypothetical protein